MKVLKFGGTSLANWKRFSQAADLIRAAAASEPVATVLSAPATVTNSLLEMIDNACQGKDHSAASSRVEALFNNLFADAGKACLNNEQQQILARRLRECVDFWNRRSQGVAMLGECSETITAAVAICGEYLSAALMEQVMLAHNLQTLQLDPVKMFKAYGPTLDAMVDIEASRKDFTTPEIAGARVLIMPGFGAGDKSGKPVTLGRNGSDYSAAVMAACLRADTCEIWTDVDGVFNVDPNLVPDARLLPQLSYRETMEMSYFGAKVLHPKTISPIAQYHIPCYIKNSLNPSAPGTLVSDATDTSGLQVKAISNLDKQTMVNVSGPGMKGLVGMASRVFSAISRSGVSVSLITQSSSEYSICFCIASVNAGKVDQALHEEFELELQSGFLEPVEFRHNLAIVSLIGDGMRTRKGLAAKFFKAMAQSGVNIIAIAQGASERSISVVIDQQRSSRAVAACHQVFFDVQQYLDVLLVGCGNIGTAMLNQINQQRSMLHEQQITIRVCGIANSKKMLLDGRGIDLDKWRDRLASEGTPCDLTSMFAWVDEQQLLNPVMIDCTSNQAVADSYVAAMNAGLHVITPNKKANTRDYAYYKLLRETALRQRRQFLYETNVGAGLPVIDNLKKLIFAGDRLQRFKGILSGSLSFIFGKLDEGMSFSEATRIARDKCYTEPDPRDDLSGMDVARKVLILAREVGFEYELSDIKVESVLPAGFNSSGSIEEFMQRLPEADTAIKALVEAARRQNKRLRYVGEIDGAECRVRICEIDADDPLFTVKNGENALAFYSRYYQPIPFVLRGYGAGNEVTAAGAFADLLRTLNWTRETIL
ncbi:MAG TPA: bifunctional aspartate kinase/homoserine dehydrogenase I [Candidatus Rifleibacterium sp.]|nr:bifunctional aspartate kinase/homoserine dehydrogenase I [Candidatus Rifleibacterium sp.]